MATSKSIPAEQFGNKLPLRAKIGYGGIGLSTIANTMLVTWQLFFYTTFAGLDVATAGVIIASADILAAFVAPVWGYISDRLYRTKLGRKIGRRRGTILLTIPGLFFHARPVLSGHADMGLRCRKLSILDVQCWSNHHSVCSAIRNDVQ